MFLKKKTLFCEAIYIKEADNLIITFSNNTNLAVFKKTLQQNEVDFLSGTNNSITVLYDKISKLPDDFFQNFPGLFNTINNAVNSRNTYNNPI